MNCFNLQNDKTNSFINQSQRESEFATVMRALIWRYISMKHREMENVGVTEEDVNEIKSELSTMKYDFLEVLRKNGMEVPSDHRKKTSMYIILRIFKNMQTGFHSYSNKN